MNAATRSRDCRHRDTFCSNELKERLRLFLLGTEVAMNTREVPGLNKAGDNNFSYLDDFEKMSYPRTRVVRPHLFCSPERLLQLCW